MRRNLHLYGIVFVSGASVLAIEILGTRILGPFYGVSLFLWSALITVTLAALSAGYAVGGWWADRGPTLRRLSSLLAGAGVWVLLVPLLRGPLLSLVEPLGLRAAVLLAAFFLFAPPLFLLGMVSPYAIRLKVAGLEEVGRTAGGLYAVSTLASVLAALVTGFFLIPSIGVSRITLSIGVVLVAAALPGLRVRGGGAAAVGVLIVGALAAWKVPAGSADPGRGLLAVRQSPYGEIRVLDDAGRRYLLIDGGAHTVVDRESGASMHPYVEVFEVAKFFFEKPGRLLLVGLGGGSVVKNFSGDDWQVDAVEIDPVVMEVAREYFDLRPDQADVHHVDGRLFLSRKGESYDLILLDAFGSSSIPFHLVTREAFELAANRLSPDGVLAINVEAVGWHDVLVRSVAATLREHFDRVVALPTAEPPNTLGNVVLMAANRPLAFPEEYLKRPYDYLNDPVAHALVLFMNHAWDNRFEPSPQGARILTDDLNPVDIWGERINLVARRALHERFREGGSW
jgi:spermidine synthase